MVIITSFRDSLAAFRSDAEFVTVSGRSFEIWETEDDGGQQQRQLLRNWDLHGEMGD